ncbi:UNVERIFIED_CONTAM: hypothetical protein GTU68_055355 [Idotea baltica]|nr:hypothetical protein [Idotea baltica]
MTVIDFTRDSCAKCPIRHRAVCSSCDDDELLVLEKIKRYRSFEAGQPIVWRGDALNEVASVVSGVASISQSMEDGRTQMVGLLFASDFIGGPGRDIAPYDVTAVTEVTLCSFERPSFEQIVKTTPNVSSRLIEMALDELDAARDWMLLLGRKTAREKIASLLALISRRAAVQTTGDGVATQTIELPLTREAMADYLGLTLETVSRQMSRLKAEGVIQLDGKRIIHILDVERLLIETGDDEDGGIVV